MKHQNSGVSQCVQACFLLCLFPCARAGRAQAPPRRPAPPPEALPTLARFALPIVVTAGQRVPPKALDSQRQERWSSEGALPPLAPSRLSPPRGALALGAFEALAS